MFLDESNLTLCTLFSISQDGSNYSLSLHATDWHASDLVTYQILRSHTGKLRSSPRSELFKPVYKKAWNVKLSL